MTGPARELADVLNRSRGEFLSTAMRDRSLMGDAFYRLDEEPTGRRLTYLPSPPGAGPPGEPPGLHRRRSYPESRFRSGTTQRVRLMVGEFLHIKAGVDPRFPAWGHSPLAGGD